MGLTICPRTVVNFWFTRNTKKKKKNSKFEKRLKETRYAFNRIGYFCTKIVSFRILVKKKKKKKRSIDNCTIESALLAIPYFFPKPNEILFETVVIRTIGRQAIKQSPCTFYGTTIKETSAAKNVFSSFITYMRTWRRNYSSYFSSRSANIRGGVVLQKRSATPSRVRDGKSRETYPVHLGAPNTIRFI